MRDKFKSNRWWAEKGIIYNNIIIVVTIPTMPLNHTHSFVPPSGSSSTFAIRHFMGGNTVYDLYSLLNANADTIADDIVSTFNNKASSNS